MIVESFWIGLFAAVCKPLEQRIEKQQRPEERAIIIKYIRTGSILTIFEFKGVDTYNQSEIFGFFLFR